MFRGKVLRPELCLYSVCHLLLFADICQSLSAYGAKPQGPFLKLDCCFDYDTRLLFKFDFDANSSASQAKLFCSE